MCYVAYTLLMVFEEQKRQPANLASGREAYASRPFINYINANSTRLFLSPNSLSLNPK